MNTIKYKSLEFFIIFILTPISFAINYTLWLKLLIGITGFFYIIYILFKVEKEKFKMKINLNWIKFCRETLFKFIILALITTLFVYLNDNKSLFEVILNKPKLWIFILFYYTLFSVYPQELIYRTFFFKRYSNLFKDEKLLIFINALVFCLGHIFLENFLVIVLTFFGGILFALTFKKTQSTLLVSIEHAIYGSWLFTVGMGSMLGFPS